jgi:hypothetical protein
MKKILPIFMIFLLLLGAVSVLAETTVSEELIKQMKGKKDAINKQLEELPGIAKILIVDDRINFDVRLNGDVEKYKIEIKDNQISSINEGSFEKPSILIKTDVDTLKQIMDAKDQRAETKKALEDEKLTIKGKGFFTRIRVGSLRGIIKRLL